MNFLNWLGELSGYKQKYESVYSKLVTCQNQRESLRDDLVKADEQLRQLELLVKKPAPEPLTYIVEKNSAWVEAQLNAMKLDIHRLPLDGNYKLTNRKNFTEILDWDDTDTLQYLKDIFDCEDFAMLFKVMTHLIFRINNVVLVIDYKSGHGYNLILFAESEHMILEPQSDGLYLWTKRLTDFYSLEGAYALI